MAEKINQITLRLKGEIREFFLKFQKEMGFQTDSQTIMFIISQYMRFLGEEMQIIDLKEVRKVYDKNQESDNYLRNEIDPNEKNQEVTQKEKQMIILNDLKKQTEFLMKKINELEKQITL